MCSILRKITDCVKDFDWRIWAKNEVFIRGSIKGKMGVFVGEYQ